MTREEAKVAVSRRLEAEGDATPPQFVDYDAMPPGGTILGNFGGWIARIWRGLDRFGKVVTIVGLPLALPPLVEYYYPKTEWAFEQVVKIGDELAAEAIELAENPVGSGSSRLLLAIDPSGTPPTTTTTTPPPTTTSPPPPPPSSFTPSGGAVASGTAYVSLDRLPPEVLDASGQFEPMIQTFDWTGSPIS